MNVARKVFEVREDGTAEADGTVVYWRPPPETSRSALLSTIRTGVEADLRAALGGFHGPVDGELESELARRMTVARDSRLRGELALRLSRGKEAASLTSLRQVASALVREVLASYRRDRRDAAVEAVVALIKRGDKREEWRRSLIRVAETGPRSGVGFVVALTLHRGLDSEIWPTVLLTRALRSKGGLTAAAILAGRGDAKGKAVVAKALEGSLEQQKLVIMALARVGGASVGEACAKLLAETSSVEIRLLWA
jgi:hypothetical protein